MSMLLEVLANKLLSRSLSPRPLRNQTNTAELHHLFVSLVAGFFSDGVAINMLGIYVYRFGG